MTRSLADAATQQKALVSKDAAKACADFLDQVDPQAKGKFSGAVNGQQAVKAASGSRTLDSAQPVEKFAAPIVFLDSAASINWATPASAAGTADENCTALDGLGLRRRKSHFKLGRCTRSKK